MNAAIMPIYRKKPLQLRVLCVLAFVFSGTALIYTFLFLLAEGWQRHIWVSLNAEILPEVVRNMGPQVLNIVGLVLSVSIFIGIIQIWKQVKFGFWVFSVSILLMLLFPFFLLEVPFLILFRAQFLYMLIASLFIIFFGYNRKFMN